mgnify:CR=1 FL=1
MSRQLLLGLVLLASLVKPGVARSVKCAALLKVAPTLIENIDVYVAEDYPGSFCPSRLTYLGSYAQSTSLTLCHGSFPFLQDSRSKSKTI